ncbi:MAG TPA: hypothetical protein VJN29_06565 [Intrasporangium sp.]|uniref:hypothetical protein n=1 Tax=Intrasporangium sp. TaxID=1925024 RepID=UPI002B495C3F|nr:hypothetical protein [Intrasporangium sp.]HKX66868.1 hypothetical protein [Intrasporangium sp.]
MTEFDHTPTDPPTADPTKEPTTAGGDPSANDVPHEPDEGDLRRGDADGSTGGKPALEESLDDAGDIAGVQTHGEEDSSVS